MKRFSYIPILLLLIFANSRAIELPALFSDNMILQQNTEIKIWGLAAANEKVDISAGWGESVSVHSDAKGQWHCEIQTPAAGGPFDLEVIAGQESRIIKNILIGEVWLCSGQSNMEMPLAGWPPKDPIQNSAAEIEQANYSQIRLFTVTKAYAAFPKQEYLGTWDECNSQTVRNFSATAYFFGRELHQKLGVPIGLIHSSWGGTPVQSWMDREHLNRFEEFHTTLTKIDSSLEQIQVLEEWLNRQPVIQIEKDMNWSGLKFADEITRQIDFDDSLWPEMDLPQRWEDTKMGIFDGVVCFRKKVAISETWIGQDLVLELGRLDDMDATYLNGVKIGGFENDGFWNANRIYAIPGSLVDSETLLVNVRVIDTRGSGGFRGEPDQLKLSTKNNPDDFIELKGKWRYLPLAEYRSGRLHLFDIGTREYLERPRLPLVIGARTPTCLYNAMIYPLKPFTIKGVIWYQGESNSVNPEQYDDLFPAMILNWRKVWKNPDLSFYYTQIAPYNYSPDRRSQRLREAQLKTLRLPNTGMAVTLDIGNPQNIHPANKQDVGKRLALWALAKDYGKKVTFSGPIYDTMTIKENKIVLSFKYAENGLYSEMKQLNEFQIAGGDKNFLQATAYIDGSKVIVYHPAIKNPVAVRYGWSNTTGASLFNTEGLPASSFRTDNW